MNEDEIIRRLKRENQSEYIWKFGLEIWVKRWGNFVNEVANGYKGSIDEYRNDLEAREVIEIIGYDKREDVLKLDEEYKKLLTQLDKRVSNSEYEAINDWWNFGIPINSEEDFKKYIILT